MKIIREVDSDNGHQREVLSGASPNSNFGMCVDNESTRKESQYVKYDLELDDTADTKQYFRLQAAVKRV